MDSFSDQLAQFHDYAQAGFPLSHLVSPVSNVQPVSLPGDLAGKAAGAVASAVAPGFSALFSMRAVAFVLGIVAIIGALFLFKPTQEVVRSTVKGAIAA